jgi:hypothetical protein
MGGMRTSHWTQGWRLPTLEDMTYHVQTTATATASGRSLADRITSLRETLRARRATQSLLAREISSYPATRSSATVVLPR